MQQEGGSMTIPPGMNSVNVYLVVPNSMDAIEFYGNAFGATPGLRIPGPMGDRTTMHAEVKIGNSTVMLTDENPAWEKKSPATLGGSPVGLHIYVDDVDAAFAKATEAGCTVGMPPSDTFWGDRFCQINDPYGHTWSIATHVKTMTEEEILAGAQEWFKAMAGQCQQQEENS